MNYLLRSLFPLLLVVAALILIAAYVGADEHSPFYADQSLPAPEFHTSDGRLGLNGHGQQVLFTTDGSLPALNDPHFNADLDLRTVQPARATLAYMPTSPQWDRPIGTVPVATMVQARAVRADRMGPVRSHTLLQQAHRLPVISLVAQSGAFFDADTGIYVPGHAVFQNDPAIVTRFARDGSWWKYPGNYQCRGKAWERRAYLEVIDPQQGHTFKAPVGVRINGQNSRGFPVKSLRILFDDPVSLPLFNKVDGSGLEAMILRTSGNDHNRTLFRDALQHELCRSLPFEVAAAKPVVLYLCGEYWGIHQARHRSDDDELARRHGLSSKKITILEDRGEVYRGKEKARAEFWEQLFLLEKMSESTSDRIPEMVAQHFDVDDLLQYISAQVILGNTDWPDQNLKYWRWEGEQDSARPVTDGRWRMIMGDSDMGFGYLGGGPEAPNMLRHIARKQGPIARLFKVLMVHPSLRERFKDVVLQQLSGPLSGERMLQGVKAWSDRIREEVPQHVRRWRRPNSIERWQQEVERALDFARGRPAAVKEQLKELDELYAIAP